MSRFVRISIVCALTLCLFGGEIFAQKSSKVKFKARVTQYKSIINKRAHRLIGDVVFDHEGALMYCDSAYFYSKKNSLDAYKNVYINQGDTLHVYGDYLHYDGNTKQATITGKKVRLITEEFTLNTTELDYDMAKNAGHYSNRATIVNDSVTIESIKGSYFSNTKTIHFLDSVVITNPDFVIYSDTVDFKAEEDLAYFFGPTNIYSDSTEIYCERGWYNTETDETELRQNAWVEGENNKVTANYIYYNELTGDGVAKDDVSIFDYEQDVIFKGEHAEYNELTEMAFLTGNAEFIQISNTDSLFLHGDTLRVFPDTAGNNIVLAYYNVKMYRSNFQSMSDSLIYTASDSIVRMYKDPVIWMDNNQLSADEIVVYTQNQTIRELELNSSSFIASQEADDMFNQIKGKDMICRFGNGELKRIDVFGNSQTVYYPKEGPDLVGVNVSECSNMKIHLQEGEVYKINFYVNPKSVLYPLEDAPENEVILKGFIWHEDERPKTRYDIFK